MTHNNQNFTPEQIEKIREMVNHEMDKLLHLQSRHITPAQAREALDAALAALWAASAFETVKDIMAADTVRQFIQQYEEMEATLKPFAIVGKIIDGPFGPALFAEDDMAFSSGCAWSENGESKTLTWGNFRRAAAAMKGE